MHLPRFSRRVVGTASSSTTGTRMPMVLSTSSVWSWRCIRRSTLPQHLSGSYERTFSMASFRSPLWFGHLTSYGSRSWSLELRIFCFLFVLTRYSAIYRAADTPRSRGDRGAVRSVENRTTCRKFLATGIDGPDPRPRRAKFARVNASLAGLIVATGGVAVARLVDGQVLAIMLLAVAVTAVGVAAMLGISYAVFRRGERDNTSEPTL